MPETQKVTDLNIIELLDEQDIDKDKVEFEDYSVEHPSTKIYITPKGRIAVCQGLPKVNCNGVKICGNSPNETMVGWKVSPTGYHGKPNVFSVNTVGTKVYLERLDNQKKVEWSPQVFLDGVETHCSPNPDLLDDKTNPNYHQNVLEWDYGVCKRRLRVIEGFISDLHPIYSNPHGEVRVKTTQSGDLKLSLSGAIDAEGNSLGRVEGDEEIVSKEEFDKAAYPVTIGASLTVYSTALDGSIECLVDPGSWDDAHDAANGTTVSAAITRFTNLTKRWTATKYHIIRDYLYFDTSALGADAVISAATLTLYGRSKNEDNAGHADLGIVEGTFDVANDGLAAADFGAILTATTLMADTYYDYDAFQVSVDEPLANDKALNATGIGKISLTSITKFALKLKGDIDDAPPAGDNDANYCRAYCNEWGAGYIPRLVITYTVPTDYPISTSTGLTVNATITRVWNRPIATSTGLTVSATINKTLAYARATSPELTVSATISRAMAFARATSPRLMASVTISRALAFTRATISNLVASSTISRTLAYARASSPGLTISTTIISLWRHFRRVQAFTNVRSIVSATVRAIEAFTNVRRHE